MTIQLRTPHRLHVTEEGEGTPVVLLHGSASNGKQWRSLTGYIKANHRVVIPDLPGYGNSARPVGVAPSLEDTAKILLDLITDIGEPVHLVGHSFGASVALKLATLTPHKVLSLTLIEPATFSPYWTEHGISAPQTRKFVSMAQCTRARLAHGKPFDAMNRFFDFWNGSGTWQRSSVDMRVKLASLAAQVVNDFRAMANDKMTADHLANVACPVQILRGTASPAVVEILSRHLLARLPFAGETLFDGAGHMLPLTDPHLVDPAIGRFINGVDRIMNSCANTMASAA